MKEFRINFTQSLSGRLFRLVFGGYVILAIVVTLIQLLLEYSSIQKTISQDLTSIGKSFNGGVSEAMWEMDEALLRTIAEGISQSSIVTGVKIMSDSGVIFAEVGSIPITALSELSDFLSHTQFYTSNLQKESVFGIRDIGVMTVYSDRSVAIDRVKYSFFVILINSLIKTAGLWIIFWFVITKSLSRPLLQLTNVVSQLEFVAESKEPIALDYPDKSKRDELSRLIAAMDKMQQRLFKTHRALTESNKDLEKKVEERTGNLADALTFNKTVLDSSPIPIGVYLATGQCVLANNSYASFVGLTKERLLSQNFNDIEAWKQSSVLKDCIAAVETNKRQKNEASVISSGGKAVWFEYQIIPTVLKGTPHLLIQFFDLSVYKQTEETLSKFNNSLEEKVKEEVEKNKEHQKVMILQSRHAQMGEILSMIAHQWRHPLNNLSLIIQNAVFKYSVGKLDDNEVSKLDLESSTQIKQMSNTIKEFKTFFLPDNESVKYDINRSIVDALSIVKPILEAESIFLDLDTQDNIFVKGFPTELGQAIVNIITNSKDALVEKNIITKSIKLSLVLINNDVKITIEDNGGGVPLKILEKIFDPYFSTKMEKNGTGLGLYMTKIIVEDHMHGKLRVANSNNGFVVEIVIPQEI